MKNKLLLLIISFSLFLVACGESTSKSSENTAVEKQDKSTSTNIKLGIEKGNKLPDFEMTNLLGGSENFYDHHGQLILLNFWATWCPPCRHEMPSMEKLYQNKGNKNFTIIAVSLDQDPINTVADFVSSNNYSFPIYYDSQHNLGRKFLVQAIPQTFIINKDGIIVDKISGAFDWKTLDIDLLLKEGE
jgi:thiol-disulfide isomerase/thioredoxin